MNFLDGSRPYPLPTLSRHTPCHLRARTPCTSRSEIGTRPRVPVLPRTLQTSPPPERDNVDPSRGSDTPRTTSRLDPRDNPLLTSLGPTSVPIFLSYSSPLPEFSTCHPRSVLRSSNRETETESTDPRKEVRHTPLRNSEESHRTTTFKGEITSTSLTQGGLAEGSMSRAPGTHRPPRREGWIVTDSVRGSRTDLEVSNLGGRTVFF